ncbi:MAG: hypothetical protein ACREA0_33695 [bacterium]
MSWIRVFTRSAAEHGIDVQIIDATPEHTERCRQWDIPMYTPGMYTPGHHPVPRRLADSEPRLGPEPHVPLPEKLQRVEAWQS